MERDPQMPQPPARPDPRVIQARIRQQLAALGQQLAALDQEAPRITTERLVDEFVLCANSTLSKEQRKLASCCAQLAQHLHLAGQRQQILLEAQKLTGQQRAIDAGLNERWKAELVKTIAPLFAAPVDASADAVPPAVPPGGDKGLAQVRHAQVQGDEDQDLESGAQPRRARTAAPGAAL